MTELLSSPVALLLFQVGCILVVSRLFGAAFRYLGQPLVVAEIIAGLALGPSLLGQIAPEAMTTLFPPDSLQGLSGVSQIGLILFMFVVGLEFDLDLLKNRGPVAVVISAFSILFPFLAGSVLALACYPLFSTSNVPFSGFALFMGASMSVTAFPVLARILSERGLLSTRTGALALTCAAVGDVSAWCILAFVIAVVRSGGVVDGLGTTLLAIVFVAVMLGVMRPFLARLARRFPSGAELSQTTFAAILALLLVSALVSEAIHIHALFGAFLFGAIVPREGHTVRLLIDKIEYLVVVLLLPLFFAFTGLRTTIGLVDTPELWAWCGLITLVATVGKVVGSALPARLSGIGWRESATLGVLLNTRGLMELIILNIGLDLGVLSPLLFTMLVLMAVVTTVVTSPVVRLLFPPSRVLAERLGTTRRPNVGGVLAAVSLPESAPGVARILAALCAGGKGPAWALRLIPLSENASMFPERDPRRERGEHDAAQAVAVEAAALGLTVEPLSLTSSDPPRAIVDTARLRSAELIVLGLHRPLIGTARLGGPILQIVQQAECDVCMLHERDLGEIRRVLSVTGGSQDEAAERVADRLAGAPGVEIVRQDFSGGEDRVARVLEAAVGFDLVVIGSGGEWELPIVPLEIRTPRLFSELPCSLLIVHGARDGGRDRAS